MDRILIQNPEMCLRLAQILFGELQPWMKLEWFEPLTVCDENEFWFLTGTIDSHRELPLDEIDEQFVNQTFSVRVKKTDAEVIDVGVTACPKMPPEVEAQVRTILEARRKSDSDATPDGPSDNTLWMNQFLHGGIINSNEAAIQFAKLIFENYFSLEAENLEDMHAELSDGVWRVTGQSDRAKAEIVFARDNARVTSLNLLP
jgi:hypothetical protein